MEIPFHYIVRVNLVRFIKDNKIDFIKDEIEFKDINPIIARENAIDYYNSYIDTLLEPNLSHNEIKSRLSDKIHIEGDSLSSLFNGIGVIMKINTPIDIQEEYFIDEEQIHGVGHNSAAQSLMDSLNTEIEYYTYYKFDTKNYCINVKFYDADANEVYGETILKTPFDWAGYEIPYTGDEDDNEMELVEIPNSNLKTFIDCIEYGEGNQIEFKSSLVSYKNGNSVGYSRHVIFKIIKAIASFLNSNGGVLFVGVNDDKSILGLDTDFSLAQSKSDNPKDYFKLQVDNIIKQNFKSVATFINGDFVEVEDKIIYIFIIEPSPSPVFVKNTTDKDPNNHKKEFYVRLTGASSIHYYDTEEIVEYCLNHWRK